MQPSQERTRSGISSPGNKWTALCLAVLLVAGAEFAVRGPVRAIREATHFNDFLSPYIQANAWIHGMDPYNPQTLLTLWPAGALHFDFVAKEVADGSLVARRGIPTAYPLTSLVLISPFSVLPWSLANALWLTTNLVLFAIMLCVLVMLSGFSYRDPSAILLVAAILALAPIHTGIVTGNVVLIAVELGVIAVWAVRRHRDVAAAVLLALSAGLKPQIGLCFLFYYLVRRRYRVFAISLAILLLIAALGILRLAFSHTSWLGNYLNNNRALLATGTIASFTPVNPGRFGLINFQVILYQFVHSVRLANDLALLVGAAFLIVWMVCMLRTKNRNGLELLDLSAIAVASLVPVYHRPYDAMLLVLPLCWVCISFKNARVVGYLSLLLMLPFTIPGGTILEIMQASGRIPSTLTNHWWWEMIVLPHQAWMLFFLSILLLYEMTMYHFSKIHS